MEWIVLVIVLLSLIHLFRSVSFTLLILHAGRFNDFPKLLNVILIWLLPFYWIEKVKTDIRRKKEIKTDYLLEDIPIEGFFDDF